MTPLIFGLALLAQPAETCITHDIRYLAWPEANPRHAGGLVRLSKIAAQIRRDRPAHVEIAAEVSLSDASDRLDRVIVALDERGVGAGLLRDERYIATPSRPLNPTAGDPPESDRDSRLPAERRPLEVIISIVCEADG